MIRKCFSLLLITFLLLTLLGGCGEAVSNIAGNVADAALKELEEQVKSTLQTHKVDVVELKTVVGKLNDSDSTAQIFCAALVRSDSDALPQTCADSLNKIFKDAGLVAQTDSKVENDYLVHKSITYKHTDYSQGGYYTIFVYQTVSTDGLLPAPAKG